VSAGIVAYGWSDDEAADLREGVDAATTAVRIDPSNPYSHYALAITSAFADEFGQSIRAAEMAIELSPGFALGHLVLGMARLFPGASGQAVEALEHGLRLNPYDPQNFVWHNLLGLANFFEGRLEPPGAGRRECAEGPAELAAGAPDAGLCSAGRGTRRCRARMRRPVGALRRGIGRCARAASAREPALGPGDDGLAA